jgi:serine/threonine protein kinase/Tfp pilus assembly protein PilF
MDQDRWKTVNQIFHAALEVPSSERPAFVKQASSGDPDLQAEVVLLLKADEDAGSYLESPLLTDESFARPASAVNPGDVLCGRFRILREIGEGGMGQVFEALDSELAVHVGLKIIRSEIAANPEALARFRQEVRLARRITHPNVCRTFDLERDTRVVDPVSGARQEVVFLTMEFLEGETLASRIKLVGPLPLSESAGIARQIADALLAAHALGIVHRDMKPANIMLVPVEAPAALGFRAVITDFGLARLDPLITSGNLSGHCQTARPIGTLAYMAPEQLENAPVSPATDIFAFGLILFEMVTGKRAFPSDNFLSGIAHRLTGPPPSPKAIAPSLPIAWCRTIDGCLRRKPEERFESIADAISVLNGSPTGDLRLVKRQHIEEISIGSWPFELRFAGLVRTLQKRPRRTAIGVAAVMLAALAAGGFYFRSHQSKGLSDKDTVVLADFANSTGEGVFDGTLKTALAVSLNQSPFLNVLAENKVTNVLQSMARPADNPLTSEVAREVCERAGGKAFIAGSIVKLGNQYILGLKAVNCESGDLMVQEQITANGQEKVVDALGRAASTLRGRLGESLGSVQKYDVPLVDATTPSLQALKRLSLGRKWSRDLQPKNAESYYQEAIKLDPDFAMAYHDLGRLYFALGEVDKGKACFKEAFDLRNRSSEREELEITATYYEDVTGDLEKALFFRNKQVDSYPRDPESFEGLGHAYILLGKHEIAVDKFRQSIQLDAYKPATYGLLGNALISLQRFEEARKTIGNGNDRFPNVFLLHNALYGLAFLEANASEMIKEESWMKGDRQYENIGFSLASDSEAYAGHLRKAGELTQLAVDTSQRADSKETGAVWYENQALREAGFGNFNEAKVTAAKGLTPKPGSLGARVEAALAYGFADDRTDAEFMAKSLNEDFPSDTQVQDLWLPSIRAQVALDRNDPSSAIEDLRNSVPFEFGNIPFATNASCLYPTYIRGQAYLMAGQGKLAAGEFQKILDHSGMVRNCWTGALARLGLARANARQADASQSADAGAARARAISSYNDFFTLWKDADADIPVLWQAKSEYIKIARQIAP